MMPASAPDPARRPVPEPSPDAPEPLDASFRSPTPDDAELLGELMLDAFRGTLDYDGETLDEAIQEVRAYFAGTHGRALLACSTLCMERGTLAAACLVTWWDLRQAPLITYVMTGSDRKRRGLGASVLQRSLACLSRTGERSVRAVVTKGNRASERLLAGVGFAPAPDP